MKEERCEIQGRRGDVGDVGERCRGMLIEGVCDVEGEGREKEEGQRDVEGEGRKKGQREREERRKVARGWREREREREREK